jgi:acetylornithine deacetylase/succinyl-diaminopimelate desuccinylase-like protein
MSLAPVLARIDADLENATQRLLELLRIPSISTDPAFDTACETAADWLVDQLRAIGAEAQKHQTPGKPIVMGSFTGYAHPDAPHSVLWPL